MNTKLRHLNLLLQGCLFFSFSCKTAQVRVQTLCNIECPPGVIKLSSNFYIDKTQVSNWSYLEFTLWTAKVYGKNSSEYQAVFPDSSSWRNTGSNCTPFLSYFQSEKYRDSPVLCVKNEQAQKFAVWRSNRVLENILIRERIINYKPVAQIHPDSIFTSERYFKGEYFKITPHPNIHFYPSYELAEPLAYMATDSLNSMANSKSKASTTFIVERGFRNTCTWRKWE